MGGAVALVTEGATAARPPDATEPLSGVAHSAQNFADGTLAWPQAGQTTLSADAHSTQNFAPVGFSVPQLEQIKPAPSSLDARPTRRAVTQSVAGPRPLGESAHARPDDHLLGAAATAFCGVPPATPAVTSAEPVGILALTSLEPR